MTATATVSSSSIASNSVFTAKSPAATLRAMRSLVPPEFFLKRLELMAEAEKSTSVKEVMAFKEVMDLSVYTEILLSALEGAQAGKAAPPAPAPTPASTPASTPAPEKGLAKAASFGRGKAATPDNVRRLEHYLGLGLTKPQVNSAKAAAAAAAKGKISDEYKAEYDSAFNKAIAALGVRPSGWYSL